MHHQANSAGELLQDHARGNLQIGHHHHGLQARKRIARGVGVYRAHGSLDARVHGLQHVQRFRAAALAHDDAVGPHAERGAQQNALVDAALLIQIGRAGFEFHHVALLELQFGGVLDGDDALFLGNEPRERVQHSGLAGAGPARDQNSALGLHARGQKPQHPGRQGAVLEHFLLGDHVAAEAADAEARPVQSQRRNDGVDARSVLQAGVHDGLRFVDAAAHLGDDLFDDVQQVPVVLESHRRLGQFAVAFDEHLVVAVDQDIADRGLLEQRFERPETQHLVEHLFDDAALLGGGHGHALVVQQALDDAADFDAQAVLGNRGDALEVEHADQFAVNLALQLEVAVGAPRGHRERSPACRQRTIGASHGVSWRVPWRAMLRFRLYRGAAAGPTRL